MKKNQTYFQLSHFLIVLLPLLLHSVYILAAPVVNNVSPLHGLSSGGDNITITGTGFTGASQVLFGSKTATFIVNNDTTIIATTPSTVPGVVDITVTGPSGTSTPNQNDRFAYRGDEFAFLPDFNPGIVYTTDTSTNFLNPDTITVGSGPNFVAISADGRTSYCVNSLSNSISVIDVATFGVTGTIPVGQSFPILMAITQDPTTLHEIGYTSNYSSNTISQIDLTTGIVLQSVGVGAGPSGGIVIPANATTTQAVAYVTNTASSSISRIDFSTIPATVTSINTNVGSETGSSPSFITLAPDGTTAYFTDDNFSQFAVKQLLNVNTPTPTIGQVITDPSFNFGTSALFPQIAITPPQVDTGNIFAYVTNTGTFTITDAVTAINITDKNNPIVTSVLTAGLGPNGMAVTPDGSKAYVCNASTSNLVTIISGLPSSPSGTNQVVGSTPTDPTITPDQAPLAYFTANPTNSVVNSFVNFDASASVSPMGSTMSQPLGIYSYTWNFGDNSSTTTMLPTTSHQYTTTGTFNPTLTVTNLAGTSTSSTSYFNGQFFLRNAQNLASGPSAQYQVTLNVLNDGNPTTTTVQSSLNPSSYGQSVDFTATITGNIAGVAPTGSIEFFDNGNLITTVSLTPDDSTSSSTAIFSTSSSSYLLTGGSHSISAVYAGDDLYSGSSNSVQQVVNPLPTVTTIIPPTPTPSPSIYGEAVEFTAQVTTSFGTLIGTVNFIDTTSTDPNNPTIIATATLDSTGHATVYYSGLNVAYSPHSIVATYIPSISDPNHAGSTSDPVNQEVDPADTTTTVVTSGTPSIYGQQLTFTATVLINSPGGGALDNDYVSFYDGSTFLGSSTIVGNQAQFIPFNSLSVGTHEIKAVFNDPSQPVDPNFNSSNNTVTQQVNQDPTTTTVSTSGSPSIFGQTVTFTATVTPSTTTSGNPTGTVEFFDGTTSLGNGTLSTTAGVTTATLSISNLAIGSHSITATYQGDTNHVVSTSPTISQQVNQDSTITSVTTSGSPSTIGQTITFTATVAPGTTTSGNPTGTVEFFDGTTSLGTGTLSTTGGITTAILQTSTLPLGSHSITANYEGDTNHATSTSPAISQQVNQDTTTISIVTSVTPSTIGQNVTFTATVAPGTTTSGNPTGTVEFFDGTTSLGTGTLSTTGGITTAIFQTSTLSLGSHSITATYEGDTNHATSTSPAISQQVNQDATATSVATSGTPSTFGQTVTFTATITPSVPAPSTPPTGTVEFFDGTTSLGNGTLSTTSGVTTATLAISTLALGNHSITANYKGDSNYTSSMSPSITQVIIAAPVTSTLIATSGSPSIIGQSVTFTATVSPSQPIPGTPPTGTVEFFDGTTSLGTATLSTTSDVTTATLAISTLALGSHSITANYGGDPNYPSSTSNPITQQINQDPTTTNVVTSGTPSIFGQTVTFTATVTPSTTTSGNPTGTVEFFDGTISLGTGMLSTTGGVTTATLPISTLAIGNHSITANYQGDTNHITSTSLAISQQVNQDTATTNVATSGSPSIIGQTVTFTATVTPSATTSNNPTGSVDFFDGTTHFGTAILSTTGGVTTAILPISTLALGSHSITATYGGDVNYPSSTSNSIIQQVNQDLTATSVMTSSTPSTVNQTVIFTATVNPSTATSGNPTGTVEFFDGTTSLGNGTLSTTAGVTTATLPISTLSIGAHSITATYEGDTNHATSTSPAITQQVNQDTTITSVVTSSSPTIVGQPVTFTATVTPSAITSGNPTGTVEFFDGTTSLGTGMLSTTGGVTTATLSISTLAIGSHSITANYGGDDDHGASISSAITQQVNQDTTITNIATSNPTAIVDQPVTFTATVAPGTTTSDNPTGIVEFFNGTTSLGTAPVSTTGGVTTAIFQTSTLPIGSYSIMATYEGDTNHAMSTSPAITQQVNQDATITSLVTSGTPSTVSQLVTFTATVKSNTTTSGDPTGTVTFFDGATSLGTVPVSTTGGVTTAIFPTSTLTPGNHSITATYGGDTNHATSKSPAITQQVNQDPTTTSIATSGTPTIVGQPVTFTATVTPNTTISGNPTGTVTFFDGTTILGSVPLSSTGTAVFQTSTLPPGSHSITATYGGDTNHATSTSPAITQQVNQDPTTTSIATSGSPTIFGQPVTFTATVTPNATTSGNPTGTVEFFDGTTSLGTGMLLTTGGVTTATLTISTLSIGNHSITATYQGDTNHITSTSSVITQQVNQDTTTTNIATSNPTAIVGQTVTFTATVTANPPGSGIPTGNVSFSIDGGPGIIVPVVNGQATLSTANLTPGNHTISASYLGDSNFTPSTGTLTQQVNVSPVTIAVNSSQNPATLGQPVTFTTTVNGDPNLGIPTGTVTFIIDGVTVSTETLVNDQASFETSSLTAGQHTIVVVYSGDATHQGATSDPFIETILAILAPRDLEVIQVKNEFASQLDRINIITWKSPRKGEKPVAYKIYRDADLTDKVATIHASNYSSSHHHQLRYEDHNRRKDRNYTYYIVSIDEFGNVSDSAMIVYHGKRK